MDLTSDLFRLEHLSQPNMLVIVVMSVGDIGQAGINVSHYRGSARRGEGVAVWPQMMAMATKYILYRPRTTNTKYSPYQHRLRTQNVNYISHSNLLPTLVNILLDTEFIAHEG